MSFLPAAFFQDCISEQDLDEMNIEIIRSTLYKGAPPAPGGGGEVGWWAGDLLGCWDRTQFHGLLSQGLICSLSGFRDTAQDRMEQVFHPSGPR